MKGFVRDGIILLSLHLAKQAEGFDFRFRCYRRRDVRV